MSIEDFWVNLVILFLALFIDTMLGDPSNKFHPVAWMGKAIFLLENRFKSNKPIIEKVYGVLLAGVIIVIFTLPTYFLLSSLANLSIIIYIIISAVILKMTFSIKGLKDIATNIVSAVSQQSLNEAKRYLSGIVRRETNSLDKEHVISATVESIAESTVDGVTAPLFYFALFGVWGAVAYRVVNTLDSMVGYKNARYINLGWFSARLDDIANYLPARLTAFLIVFSTLLLKKNGKSSWKIMWRDRKKTESPNAGWVMAAMAGALNVRLEKIGYYQLGNPIQALNSENIINSLKIFYLTVCLFICLVVIPLVLSKQLIFS